MSRLQQHRKLFVLVFTMLIGAAINKTTGLNAQELLGAQAASFVDMLAQAGVDALIIGGIPAVLMWAQPNEADDTIWRYWKAIAVGGGIVVGLIAIAVLVL